MTVHGLIPNEIIDAIEIPVILSEISPAIDVNYLGGDLMVIIGNSFGYEASNVNITYDDGTSCEVIYVSMTVIECINKRFTSTVGLT